MREIKDLIGQRFGKLVVIERAESIKTGIILWKCKCDCGNETTVTSSNLRNGSTKSCGCLTIEKNKQKITDLTGKRFDNLTVVERAGKRGKEVTWKCICDCGNESIVMGTNLRRGHTKSCGCANRERMKKRIINLIGNRYGRLVVIERAENDERGQSFWKCKCDCGNEVIARSKQLHNGKKSCGCLSVVIDHTGELFGKLTVIERVENNKHGYARFKCKCGCGKEIIVTSHDLRNGHTKSCGCYRIEKASIPFGEAALNDVIGNYKRVAKKRKMEFTLSDDEFKELILADCFYCGKKPSRHRIENKRFNGYKRFNGNPPHNGIDRIDNGKGYVSDNVVTCCKQCNIAKRDHTMEEFKTWIKAIYEHLNLGEKYETQ